MEVVKYIDHWRQCYRNSEIAENVLLQRHLHPHLIRRFLQGLGIICSCLEVSFYSPDLLVIHLVRVMQDFDTKGMCICVLSKRSLLFKPNFGNDERIFYSLVNYPGLIISALW